MITEKEKQLLTKVGFIHRFYHHLHSSKSHREAYEKTEDDYLLLLGCSKYSSFESFKVVLWRYNRAKLKR